MIPFVPKSASITAVAAPTVVALTTLAPAVMPSSFVLSAALIDPGTAVVAAEMPMLPVPLLKVTGADPESAARAKAGISLSRAMAASTRTSPSVPAAILLALRK